jgi:hypothetical protein
MPAPPEACEKLAVAVTSLLPRPGEVKARGTALADKTDAPQRLAMRPGCNLPKRQQTAGRYAMGRTVRTRIATAAHGGTSDTGECSNRLSVGS